jgi:hypothetical protein
MCGLDGMSSRTWWDPGRSEVIFFTGGLECVDPRWNESILRILVAYSGSQLQTL